jgi:hypothetical protein
MSTRLVPSCSHQRRCEVGRVAEHRGHRPPLGEVHGDLEIAVRRHALLPPGRPLLRVGLKVDFDMALLVIASGLYRLLARTMRGYADAQARQICRDLIDMPATVEVTESGVVVEFHRRAHLPIVIASGLLNNSVQVPWWSPIEVRTGATRRGLCRRVSRGCPSPWVDVVEADSSPVRFDGRQRVVYYPGHLTSYN